MPIDDRPLPAPDAADLDHAHAAAAGAWPHLRGARLLLTGGTGFVGKWLLATLLDADRRLGLDVRVGVLSRDPQAFRRAAPHLADPARVELLRGDVRDFAFPPGAWSHVVHAATDVAVGAAPLDVFDTCVAGTRRVLDFAVQAGAADVLLVSSGAVYGRQPSELAALPESYCGALDPGRVASAYGEGKRAAEWLGAAYGAERGLRVRTARCFALIGPYLPLNGHFAAGNFLRDALAGRAITVRGDGTPQRSYLHAADMAAWLWATLLLGSAQAVYNVGGAEALSMAELARRVAAAAGSDAGVDVLSRPAAGLSADRYVPDVSRIRSQLPLGEPLDLDEALRRSVRWYRQRPVASWHRRRRRPQARPAPPPGRRAPRRNPFSETR